MMTVLPSSGVAADLFGQGEAAHAGHLRVGQYEAIGRCRAAGPRARPAGPRRRLPRLPVPSPNFSRFLRGSAGCRHCRRPPGPASPGSTAGRTGIRPPASSLAKPSRTVKWNVLPRWTSLSTHRRPCMRSTSREAMASPRPLPPKRRVIEASACSKTSKMAFCFSGGMPIPVSRTAKCKSTSPFGRFLPAARRVPLPRVP